ncbi:uncharacterized protein LOC128863967 [Anastrepha ludens]|uniref:uncharacterized protein LOC128863967 n=1 Tax=Anastrepha ludens TaxID=28586 RepID=UPI0023B1E018|nr:uncharacterized protein LOC128863967 [Anastrepha ludens]XP_053959385.1 uncharacterized protein LOC128863967 [Anastrepha ludens]
MSWVPSTDFEEEVVSMQPRHNFIYGQLCDPGPQEFHPRPKEHLDFIAKQKNEKKQREETLTKSQNHKLNIIAKVQRIAGTKPLGEQPTIHDWDDNENIERETIAMMRHVGLGPRLEQPFDEECTIASHPIQSDIRINRNGRKQIPVFFDEKYFELKPRVLDSPSSSVGTSPTKESAIAHNESSASKESSSIATSWDTSNGRYSDSPNSGFASAIDMVGDQESFETARNSDNGHKSQNWRKNKNQTSTQNWRKKDDNTEKQSWRKRDDNIETQSSINRSAEHRCGKEVNNQMQNNNWTWRNPSNKPSKAKSGRMQSPQLCSPRELYEKKRQTD